MKKLLTVAIALMLIAVMSVSVFAADEGTILAVDLPIEDFGGLGNMSAQFKGGETDPAKGCLGLGPFDYGDGDFEDAYMDFKFEVDTAGTYIITVRYAAKQSEGQIRCADMIVNGGERIALPIENTGDWAVWADAVVEVELVAGENTVTLKNVENFDNSVYKAINVDCVSWELKPVETEAPETEAPETEAPETEAPETEAPETEAPEEETPEEDAPQTGFIAAALMVVAIGSGAYIVSRKH